MVQKQIPTVHVVLSCILVLEGYYFTAYGLRPDKRQRLAGADVLQGTPRRDTPNEDEGKLASAGRHKQYGLFL